MIFRTFLAAAVVGLAAFAPAVFAHDPALHHQTVVGDLTLTNAFARATRPGAPVAGGFLTIRNTGAEDDRLTGGTAPFAKEVQVHEMAMEGDVMKMRRLDAGLVIPAGAEVTLAPGGNHLMFMGLSGPLVEGGTADVTLTFEKAGAVTVPLEIRAPGATGKEH